MEGKKGKSRKDRPRKRKFHGNQFVKSKLSGEQNASSVVDVDNVESDDVRSSSFKKLCFGLDLESGSAGKNDGNVDQARSRSGEAGRSSDEDLDLGRVHGMRLFRYDLLEEFIQLFPCPSCFHCSESVGKTFSLEEKLTGISSELVVRCNFCGYEVPSLKTSDPSENVNLRFQLAMYGIGCHETKGRRFLAAMDMPPPVSSTRSSIFRDRILRATRSVAKESMKLAASELKEADGEKVTVSCDGSWQRRGFSSKNGVATCLSVSKKVPAKVLDTEVLSNHCDSCCKMENRKSDDDLRKWKEAHAGDCQKNHEGSAGSMEPVGMKRIFERSEESYNLKYVGYLGDGDSKSFKFVADADPPIYGEDVVEKLECCGHVQKRMGKRLMDKVAQCKSKEYVVGKKKVRGIGGAGKLTKVAIKRIQGHYGGAVRKNVGDLEKMKKSIWAIWYHRSGVHDHCGAWCDGSDKNKLPSFVMEEIKSVFEDLSDDRLLKKCLHGGTQNANESFHHLVWERCPKSVFVGRDRLEIAVRDATIVFNDGEVGKYAIFRKLGLYVGEFMKVGFRDLDYRRIKSAENQEKADQKKKRVQRNIVAASGDVDYQYGGF